MALLVSSLEREVGGRGVGLAGRGELKGGSSGSWATRADMGDCRGLVVATGPRGGRGWLGGVEIRELVSRAHIPSPCTGFYLEYSLCAVRSSPRTSPDSEGVPYIPLNTPSPPSTFFSSVRRGIRFFPFPSTSILPTPNILTPPPLRPTPSYLNISPMPPPPPLHPALHAPTAAQ